MSSEIGRFVILMAIAVPIQLLTYFLYPIESSLIEIFEAESGFSEGFRNYFARIALSSIAYVLPSIASAYWISTVSSVRLYPKIAWIVLALVTQYFVLLFYMAAKIAPKSDSSDQKF
ncbi:hypothetical protein ACNKU7_18615 [Microbulbifer sp. SA54]|uniref:hypothetical protein n=1 Tax=Microbulbifer sp. SA54 TaxID=3401577 RepID=UPI003AAB75B1